MTTLGLKEQQLKDRKQQLEHSIQEMKQNINEENAEQAIRTIQATALEIQKLQAQVELTELAIQNTQDKLRARQEFEDSKEYKDKRKMQEKLTGEGREQAMSIYEKVLDLQNEIQAVRDKVDKADSIHLQLAENKVEAVWSVQSKKQLFFWLWGLSQVLEGKAQEMRTMQKRGEF